MNPLVEKMLIAQRESIDVRTLEQIFEHEAKCESRTHDFGRVKCSGNVTHLLSASCIEPTKVCKAMGVRAEYYISKADGVCGVCDRPIEKCWTIRPI